MQVATKELRSPTVAKLFQELEIVRLHCKEQNRTSWQNELSFKTKKSHKKENIPEG
jgi:hypothetical protein